jgi:DNA-binding LytR/AlgR family response regulator
VNYIIIENEAFALENLKQTVARLRHDYHLTFTAESIEETVEYLRTHPDISLIFMDIELVDGNCFEIFRQVKVETPVIFTTAYDDFAIQAFHVNSIDYLLKPIGDEALGTALDKLERLTGKNPATPDYATLMRQMLQPTNRQRILLNSGDNYSYAMIDDVAYFMSEDKYVYACLRSGQRRMTEFHNLAEVEGILDQRRFFQVARHIIASIESIGKVSKYFNGRLKVEVRADNDRQEAVVSAARRQPFLDWLGGK